MLPINGLVKKLSSN